MDYTEGIICQEQMDFILIAWLFALVVTLHNLEEAIWLPDWSQTAGRWHSPVSRNLSGRDLWWLSASWC